MAVNHTSPRFQAVLVLSGCFRYGQKCGGTIPPIHPYPTWNGGEICGRMVVSVSKFNVFASLRQLATARKMPDVKAFDYEFRAVGRYGILATSGAIAQLNVDRPLETCHPAT